MLHISCFSNRMAFILVCVNAVQKSCDWTAITLNLLSLPKLFKASFNFFLLLLVYRIVGVWLRVVLDAQ